jgi:D-alanyl-D-alanine carboxypeptidase
MQPQSLKNQEFRQGALLCLSLILLLLVAGGALYLDREERETATAVLEVNEPEKPRMLRDIPISARAAYVLDVNSGTVLFAKNETAQLPLASITKLMTALVILESLPSEGALTLTARDLEVEGDNGFISGERWNIGDLLEYTLTVSSNDGANALANAVSGLQAGAATHALDSFTELMNERAAYLGLSQMYFLNPTGLDSTQNISGGYGSARDVAYLLTYLIKESAAVLEATSNRQDVYYSLDNRQ